MYPESTGAPSRSIGVREGVVELFEVVPRHAGKDVVADVIVDVVPEVAGRAVADHRAGPAHRARIPGCVVVLDDEADAVEHREEVDGDEPQREHLGEDARALGPEHQRRVDDHAQGQLAEVDPQLRAAKALDRVDHVELDHREDPADQQVAVEQDEIGDAPAPHRKGVGVLGAAVEAVVLEMVLFERHKGRDQREHREHAEDPVLPLAAEEHRVGGVVHEGQDPHPDVSHEHVRRPLEPGRLGAPCDRPCAHEQRVEQRDLDKIMAPVVAV